MTEQDWPYDYFQDRGAAQVADMHQKFGLTLNTVPVELREEQLMERWRFLLEEVNEMSQAVAKDDYEGIIDALVDIVVVAKGTAVMMGIRWGPHFDEVMRANMDKERGPHNARRGEDLIKPEGWQGPDHRKVLNGYATQET